MKIKDIEKNLKKESEQVPVPDVYARVKRAPINRLLSDPVHAFQRKMVMRILMFAFVIAIVVVIGFAAIWLMPNTASQEEYGYVRVAVNDLDVYGFVVNKAGIVSASITEMTAGADALVRHADLRGKSIAEAIEALYHAVLNDEVVVSVHFDNYNTADMIATKAVGAVEMQGVELVVDTLICDFETKTKWVSYLNSHGRAASASYSAFELAKRYASLASASL